MFKLYQKILTRQSKTVGRISGITRYNGFSSSTAAELKNVNDQPLPEKDNSTSKRANTSNRSNLVKIAFASMQLERQNLQIETPATDEKINKAESVDELLSISKGVGVSRQHALKVVSVLSNWTLAGKVKIEEFEADPRFIRLCKILTKNNVSRSTKTGQPVLKNEDLSTILNITADEEAAKIVTDLSVPQMLRVLSTLSAKGRRLPLLLRTIAYNITASPETLNIKQCADLLYSISVLNFYDDNLLDRVSDNISNILYTEKINKTAVIGSILTSIGLLRFKSPVLLDAISEWIVKNHTICRPQDLFSLFMTLGVIHYIPSNGEALFKLLIPQLTQEEAGRPLIWLEIVWSLLLLNQASTDHVKSILNDQFLKKLEVDSSLPTSVKLKLLNIDGAAHYLINNYDGPKIPSDHDIRKTSLSLSKEKTEMVSCLMNTLKNLISENNLRSRVNTGLGFYIDAECLLDKQCNAKPLTTKPSPNLKKIAILAYEYRDMTKGKIQPTGVNIFSQHLLKAMGYKIVSVPYTDFKIKDKVVNRVKFLETQLREAVVKSP